MLPRPVQSGGGLRRPAMCCPGRRSRRSRRLGRTCGRSGRAPRPGGRVWVSSRSMLVRAGRAMTIGLRHSAARGLAADDRDRRMGQAGEVARHVAHPHPAAILVVREVPHGVQAVLSMCQWLRISAASCVGVLIRRQCDQAATRSDLAVTGAPCTGGPGRPRRCRRCSSNPSLMMRKKLARFCHSSPTQWRFFICGK